MAPILLYFYNNCNYDLFLGGCYEKSLPFLGRDFLHLPIVWRVLQISVSRVIQQPPLFVEPGAVARAIPGTLLGIPF